MLAALFVLGTAETFADIGDQQLLPRLVRRGPGRRERQAPGGVLVANQWSRRPSGRYLFAIGMALPFVAMRRGSPWARSS